MDKPTILDAISDERWEFFHGYISLPEGTRLSNFFFPFSRSLDLPPTQ